MAKYKIVKRADVRSIHLDRYHVFRKFLWFWKHVSTEWTQKEAEEFIVYDRKIREHRKKKPEVMGYYD